MSGFSDTYSGIRGVVSPYILLNGERKFVGDQHNMVLYGANRILSQLMVRNSVYAPYSVLFLSNDDSSSTISPAVSRGLSYNELTNINGYYRYRANLAQTTTRAATDGSASVKFLAYTGGSGAGQIGGFVKRAVLCSSLIGSLGYEPFSAVDFSSPIAVPDDAEFGVFWTITFGIT
jgi:hypothetical protein